MNRIPRITAVEPCEDFRLKVIFTDGSVRLYDVRPLLELPAFRRLQDPDFFRQVRIEPGGYAVSWNDEADISEYELWRHGVPLSSREHAA
ncbi:hypothetical protein MIN45_P0332 [Methylomarinovum tepidoasis]|uniref:DUF2442 domain-containing protein n=2 Tax=Methylomarinovum tepidoasis TaxID=2840183 RepID=A0AAU9BWI3_9GAMM|nr:DUF2442 domain-containing protein [Methylomarinovum sp. IN45]BCX87965.1 hypothetical protein MIN45_P0332 [Methylomarinovum sp. IN45]